MRVSKRSSDVVRHPKPTSHEDLATPQNRPANARVCEKTGDCLKRRARSRRFINDLREVRGLYPWGSHRPTRLRSRLRMTSVVGTSPWRSPGLELRLTARADQRWGTFDRFSTLSASAALPWLSGAGRPKRKRMSE